MKHKTRFRLKPFGALDTVMTTEPGQVFSGFGLLVQLEVPWRLKVCFDLVDVAMWASVWCNGNGA